MKILMIGCLGLLGVIIVVLLLGAIFGPSLWGNSTGGDVLTEDFVEPLNDVTVAKLDFNSGSGNLTIDWLTGGEPLLAGGTLQYSKNQGQPMRTLSSMNGQATLQLKGGEIGQPWLHFPWDACNGATEWQIHLNPAVVSDITAHSGGGNVKLNLARMTLTRLAADTGGGNVEVVLPNNAANLSVNAKTGAGNVSVEIGNGTKGIGIVSAESGAGNVVVHVPTGLAAKVHATGGMGKVIVDSLFSKLDGSTYQSADYDSVTDKVEITVHSGAGNVSVETK